MKRIAAVLISCIGSYALAQIPHPATEADQKRFVMEFRRADGGVLGVELVVARLGDEGRSPIEVLERQVGRKWGGFGPAIVYRFDPRSKPKTWEPIMFRDTRSTETRVGEGSGGLKISELQSGDVIILYAPSP